MCPAFGAAALVGSFEKCVCIVARPWVLGSESVEIVGTLCDLHMCYELTFKNSVYEGSVEIKGDSQ